MLADRAAMYIQCEYMQTFPHLPFDAAFGAYTRFSSGLGAESTLVGLLLAGVSYTYEPAPPMFTPKIR